MFQGVREVDMKIDALISLGEKTALLVERHRKLRSAHQRLEQTVGRKDDELRQLRSRIEHARKDRDRMVRRVEELLEKIDAMGLT